MRASWRELICSMALSAACAAATAQPFSVDLMVKAEGVAEVMFSPAGDRLLLEKLNAYEDSPNFAWDHAFTRDRSTLLTVDADGVRAVSSRPDERVWFASYSPRGSKAAVGWFDGDQAKAGVYDFQSGQLKKFDFLVGFLGSCVFDCPHWLSEDEFIHVAVDAQEQQKQLSVIQYTEQSTHRWALDTWKGKQPAVAVLGSGAHRSSTVDNESTLVRVNARTGEVRELGRGVIRGLSLSPDRRRLAVVREVGVLDIAGLQLQAVVGHAMSYELAIYDLATGATESFPCKGCNVSRASLRWSPSGNKLFFATRQVRDGKMAHEHHIYDFRRARLERFEPRGIPFDTEANQEHYTYDVPFVWLTESTPAVRITRRQAGSDAAAQYEWFALPPGRAPVSLTKGLSSRHPLSEYLAVHDGHLLMMVDGDVWRLSANGARKNLTQDIAEPLHPWCPPYGFYRGHSAIKQCRSGEIRANDREVIRRGWLTFTTMREGASTDDVLFLNVASGERQRLAKPSSDAELVSASAPAKAAVYMRNDADGDRLLLIDKSGAVRELLHFNRHLAGVTPAKAVMLTRREPTDREDRYDWLLLPADHKPGDRHPLLVYFYPDTEYSPDWRSDGVRTVTFLNMQLAAARGYAVLFASMRIASYGQRGNPMVDMHEQLIHAAENAVQAGYADPERWAVMGHSYGGYGVASVVTQTNRFKAAIALAGTYNLTSGYANGLAPTRATGHAHGRSYGAEWSESGQGRMGVPPWQDPQRYIDNSPFFHAHQIETPLLLIHGDEDFVHVNGAEQLFAALYRQGKDAQLLRYWGEGHIFYSPANIRDMWDRIFAWLERYLQADTATDAS
jgi:dipeptidyl aminopeptidase/acylaminoacyl peptidase